MTTSTIIRFLFGNADAIRKVAESKSALGVGMILVLLTAIARNYDQTFILEKPFLWLFGPLLFSIGSGTFIFLLIYGIFVRRHLPKPSPPFSSQYLSFLGLFWMTAPIAWIYALPVERFLTSYQAAQMNIMLLATVSLWRVLLLGRIFAVIQETRFWRALLWVLLPAAMEVFALYIFSDAFSKKIMQAMGGMRNSPEEELLLGALSVSANAAMWTGLVCLVLLPILRNRKPLHPFPERHQHLMPSMLLIFTTIFWVSMSIYPQRQLQRNAHIDQLVANEKYVEALRFLANHEPDEFAPSRVIPPKPYEYEIFEKLPQMLAAMDGSEPKWVRDLYLSYLTIMVSHEFRWNKPKVSHQGIVDSLNKIPEGPAWLSEHDSELSIFTMQVVISGETNSAINTTNTPPK